MSGKKQRNSIQVSIDKLVPGGQGLGVLPDGKKVFVWGALPGEIVEIRITRSRSHYAEGIADRIVKPATCRIEPREQNFLATSPWQIMSFEAENKCKEELIADICHQQGLQIHGPITVAHDDRDWRYRNKMEYGFWGDDNGLHLAQFRRDSHQKQVVVGSELAMTPVDQAAAAVCQSLSAAGIRAGQLKTIIVRCDQTGRTTASLYVKDRQFPGIVLPEPLQGLRIYFSNPKSPASVRTEQLYEYGDCELHDLVLGKDFKYDTDSFFQINIPLYELALKQIADNCSDASVTDMYAGVGSIGLAVAKQSAELVELDAATAAMARQNAARSGLQVSVVEASAEKALDAISPTRPVIFDPPRAGLHLAVTDRVLKVLPPDIFYLSCNPMTQARDLQALSDAYTISHFYCFNFFPRTPHLETLAILRRKN